MSASLERAIGRLEGTVKAIDEKVDAGFVAIDLKVSTVVVAVEGLREWRWKLFGAATVLGAIGSGLFELVLLLIKH